MPKVLIVDDDVDLRTAIHRRLQPAGWEAVHAEDAVSVVPIGRAEKPDAILLDLGLPGGGGLVVLERLRHLPALACVPVVVLTGSDTDEEELLRLGVRAVLRKPCTDEALLAALSAAIGSPIAGGGAE